MLYNQRPAGCRSHLGADRVRATAAREPGSRCDRSRAAVTRPVVALPYPDCGGQRPRAPLVFASAQRHRPRHRGRLQRALLDAGGVLGVATGAGASALIALLQLAEHLTYGYRPAVPGRGAGLIPAAPRGRAAAGGGGGRGRARCPSPAPDLRGHRGLRGAVAARRAAAVDPQPGPRCAVDRHRGMGVSLGREAAPQLAGAAFASRLSDWAQLPDLAAAAAGRLGRGGRASRPSTTSPSGAPCSRSRCCSGRWRCRWCCRRWRSR